MTMQTENPKTGEVVKKNVDAADIVLDASVDPNSFDMINLSRICPLDKRISVTLLYSPVDVGRCLARALSECGGKVVYITGNSSKSLAEFEITEDEISRWIQAILREATKTSEIDKILSDGYDGVGASVIQAAKEMNIPVET